MRLRDIALLGMLTFALSGCGLSESSLNPFTWFSSGEDEVETIDNVTIVESQDIRPLMPVVSSLVLEETPGGVIVRATGLPPNQGWFRADLVSPTGGEPVDGILTYEFRAIPPREQTSVSTVQSREIIVARYISDLRLAEITEIRVVGESNTRTARP